MRRFGLVPALLAYACVCGPARAEGAEKVILEKESLYHYIRVVDEEGVRRLFFRRSGEDYVESAIDLKDPLRLRMGYYPLMMAALAHRPEPGRVLFVGLGGGTLPMVLRHYYPKAQIDSIELDPEVAEVARKFFGLKEDARTGVFVRDGRVQVRRFVREGRKYDLVFLDAFRGGYIPYHLTTREFLEQVQAVLADDGLVGANLQPGFESYHYQRRTLGAVFRNQWSYGDGGNVIVVADNRPKPPAKADLTAAARRLQKEKQFTFDLPAIIEAGGMRDDYERNGEILTDDYAPTDVLRSIPKD